MLNSRRQLTSILERLPREVRTALADSMARLRRSGGPTEVFKALPGELEHLVAATVPVLGEHPLPVRSAAQARLWAAGAAGGSALLQQAGELAVVESRGRGGAVLAPAVAGGMVAAWMAELWLAVTVRVRQLDQAGRAVDSAVLTAEMVDAVLGGIGGGSGRPPRQAVRLMGRRAATRMGRRWAVGLVPLVGVAYDGWDARRSIDRALALPTSAHPPAR
jgi:hypothetical protein